ncbi:MAG: thioredoxin [Bacteriovoracia bacterium]
MASQNVMQATDTNFDSDVMKTGQISLVDFWAEWCGPCRMLAPTIDALANDFAGKVKVYKMNVDENPETPSKFGIRGIPTVILFKDGKMVDQIVGNQPKDAFVQAIQRQMS